VKPPSTLITRTFRLLPSAFEQEPLIYPLFPSPIEPSSLSLRTLIFRFPGWWTPVFSEEFPTFFTWLHFFQCWRRSPPPPPRSGRPFFGVFGHLFCFRVTGSPYWKSPQAMLFFSSPSLPRLTSFPPPSFFSLDSGADPFVMPARPFFEDDKFSVSSPFPPMTLSNPLLHMSPMKNPSALLSSTFFPPYQTSVPPQSVRLPARPQGKS